MFSDVPVILVALISSPIHSHSAMKDVDDLSRYRYLLSGINYRAVVLPGVASDFLLTNKESLGLL